MTTEEGFSQEKEILYWLCQNPALGAASIHRLYNFFGDYKSVYSNIEEIHLCQIPGMNRKKVSLLLEWKSMFSKFQEEYIRLSERNIKFISHLDKEYPERLRQINGFPAGLFVMGKLPDDQIPSVAIVGARGCSAYGEQLTFEFARTLSREGIQIVSGLALGIDAAAHKGALKEGGNKGTTFGILGCGVNICYPSANYTYYTQMKEKGGVISEFPLGTQPRAMNFPMRNRIISGLSDVILVVEAKERSGSLITVELGLEQGREIFTVPGRVTDFLSMGCNRLIQQGAHVALSPGDILEYLHVICEKKLIIHEKNLNSLAKKEKMVYSCLDFKPKHLEEITKASKLPVSECMTTLMELELGGYVYRSANHYYGKKVDI